MEKEFVSYAQALSLKELGFDEPCFALFNRSDKPVISGNTPVFNSKTEDDLIICTPLYQQAFRWFRENYNLFGHIEVEGDNSFYWHIEVEGDNSFYWHIRNPEQFISSQTSDTYEEAEQFISSQTSDTYEEAELACLDKLIEICKT